jgi:hypothetical protein
MATTVKQLLARAAECETCGKEHKPRQVARGYAPSWADPDGHPYRPRIPRGTLSKLHDLAGM